MTAQETLDKLHETALDMSRRMLIEAEDGEQASVSPMILAVDESETLNLISLLGMDVNDDDEKFSLATMLPRMFAEKKIVCYAMMTEAWAVMGRGAGDMRQPKDRDDKKEVVFINMRHRDNLFLTTAHEIIRDWTTGKPTDLVLHNEMKTGDGSSLGGTFGNFFKAPRSLRRGDDLAQTA